MKLRHLAATGATAAGLALSYSVGCLDRPPAEPSSTEAEALTQRQPDAASVVPGELLSPVRVAAGPKRTLFVSDFRAQKVFRLKASAGGVRIAEAFGVAGRPLGVAWARNRLFVGNASTGSVDVYQSRSGKWLYALGGQGAVGDPSDIALDPRRGLAFVLDGEEKTVKVFAMMKGDLRYTIAGPGLADHDLQNPTGIAVDPARREVLVSDYGDAAGSGPPPGVKIFSYDGTPVGFISGKSGMLAQRFSRPQGLAVDGEGRILLVDALAGEVLVVDRESGAVLETLGGLGSSPGELWLPLDVVVTGDLDLFVTNNRPRRVEFFRLGARAP